MSAFTFAITFSSGQWLEVTEAASSEIKARCAAWASLSDSTRDCVASIECVDKVVL